MADDNKPATEGKPGEPGTVEEQFETKPMPRELLDGKGSLAEQASRAERDLILGARDKPHETRMPGTTQTVAEYREERYKADTKQFEEADRAATEHARKQSEANDIRTMEGTELLVVAPGSVAFVQPNPTNEAPPPAEGQEDGKDGQGEGSGGTDQKTEEAGREAEAGTTQPKSAAPGIRTEGSGFD